MKKFAPGLALVITAVLSSTAQANIEYDQNVTNDVIFGSGNDNGSFTTDRNVDAGIELGLRGKLRFNSSNFPENTFNSNGDGTYTFVAGLPPTGFGFALGSTSTAVWNFEFSVNSNFNGVGDFLDQYTYEIGIDFDPGPGTNYLTFDPINTAYADHAIGDNSTGNGGGTSAPSGDAAAYAALIAGNNLAQNSWNMEFFDDPPTYSFDGRNSGQYQIYLEALDSNGDSVARTEITINSVPEPSSMVLLGMGMIGLAGYGWRRRKQRQTVA